MLKRFPIMAEEFQNIYLDHFRRIFPGLIYATFTILNEEKIKEQMINDLLDDINHVLSVELFLDSFRDEDFELLSEGIRKEGAKYHDFFSAKSYLQRNIEILEGLMDVITDIRDKISFGPKGEVDAFTFAPAVNYLLGLGVQEFVGEEVYNETVFGTGNTH